MHEPDREDRIRKLAKEFLYWQAVEQSHAAEILIQLIRLVALDERIREEQRTSP